jgi:predicted DCC family thiol-disulfide oxidoreductase YuxK
MVTDATGPQQEHLPERIVLYDGVCGLCDRSVRFLIRHDRGESFRYAPLQGETAAALRRRHPEIPEDLDTLVLVEDGQVHLRSRAAFLAARQLRFPYSLLAWLRALPRPLTDLAYQTVARVRYRIWGRMDQCTFPPPEPGGHFLP